MELHLFVFFNSLLLREKERSGLRQSGEEFSLLASSSTFTHHQGDTESHDDDHEHECVQPKPFHGMTSHAT